MGGPRLSEEQVAAVLRRAAELDVGDEDTGRFDVAAVEAAALEAGLSHQAVCQALAELRVGALEAARPPARATLLGPASLVVRRAVPGPLAAVEHEVRSYLCAQLFEQRRNFGDRAVWVRREGLMPSLRRSLDLNHRLSLNGVRKLEVALAEEPTGARRRVVVCLEADVSDQRATHGWLLGGGAAAGTAVVGGAALVPGFDLLLLASLPVGAGLAIGGHLTGRVQYCREVGRIETALEGFLDRLEHRPVAPSHRPLTHGRS